MRVHFEFVGFHPSHSEKEKAQEIASYAGKSSKVRPLTKGAYINKCGPLKLGKTKLAADLTVFVSKGDSELSEICLTKNGFVLAAVVVIPHLDNLEDHVSKILHSHSQRKLSVENCKSVLNENQCE